MNPALPTAILLGFWLAISILAQFSSRAFNQKLRHWDLFSMIPRWSFFAPNPGTSDYYLVIRYKMQDGEIGTWREVQAAEPARSWATIWNPQKRKQKILSDAVSGFGLLAENMQKHSFQTTLPYLMVLQFVLDRPAEPWMDSVQFMVMEQRGTVSRMNFRSAFHRLNS